MAVLDVLWLYVSSALVLALIATLGFVTIKIGIFSYKTISEALIAVERMERNQIIYKESLEQSKALKMPFNERIDSLKGNFKNFRKYSLNNPKYAYIQLFKK